MRLSVLARAHLRRGARFLVVGASGVVVNMAAVYLLATYCHLSKILAVVLATEAATLNNFFLHDRWTYADCDPDRTFLIRLLRFHGSTLFGAGVALLVFTVLLKAVSVQYLLANLAGIATASVWYYLANARFIWAQPSVGTPG